VNVRLLSGLAQVSRPRPTPRPPDRTAARFWTGKALVLRFGG
jgi:hypothetical protein